MLIRLIVIAVLVAGCAGSTPTAPPTAATTARPPVATPAPATAEPTPSPEVAVLLPGSLPFPVADLAKPWKVVGILDPHPDDPFKSVDGIKPPGGPYILDARSMERCDGVFSGAGSLWGFDTTNDMPDANLSLVDVVADDPEGYSAFAANCDVWTLGVVPIATYFGTNSVQVARLMLKTDGLASGWDRVGGETATPDALAIEQQVLDAALRDPNLAAAIRHATAAHWTAGNHYLEKSETAATLRRLAIVAEVAQPVLTTEAFKTLYGPMAEYVDPLSFGTPVQS